MGLFPPLPRILAMSPRLAPRFAALLLALIAGAPSVWADNHKWEIAEVFSSLDGTVQFIELFNPDKDEHGLLGQRLTTSSGNVFVFPSSLSTTNTENRRLLIATAAFAAIPGAPTPDYLIPAGFLQRAGDTLTYLATPDSLTFASLPADGLTSLSGTGAQGTNSPTNFAGQSGSVRLATVTVRNGSGVNRVCYSAPRPVMGMSWTASVDTTPHAGALGVALLFYERGGSGLFFAGDEVLYDPTSVRFAKFSFLANGGISQATMNIPIDPILIGLPTTSQALILGGGREFCNALDMTVGW